MSHTILITGAAGFIGRQLTESLASLPDVTVVATDVRNPPEFSGVVSRVLDIRDPNLSDLLKEHDVDVVVHLAAILSPPKGAGRDFLHAVEVGGTRNVLEACVTAGVKRFV